MSLSVARSLIMRYKSFLCLTVAALIGPALISYNHGIVESKPAVIGDGKDKHKKKKEGNHDQDGNQVGEIKPIKIGVSVDDPEGITFDGSWFYVVSSQSGTKAEETNALVRFTFDTETQSVKEVESVGGLYQFLTDMAPELKECAGKKGRHGTVNIEGLAWDPVQGRLLLGLRDPEISEQALVVPLRLRDLN